MTKLDLHTENLIKVASHVYIKNRIIATKKYNQAKHIEQLTQTAAKLEQAIDKFQIAPIPSDKTKRYIATKLPTYTATCEQYLATSPDYKIIKKIPMDAIVNRINRAMTKVTSSLEIPNYQMSKLYADPDKVNPSKFYGLIKDHKPIEYDTQGLATKYKI